MKTNWQTKKYYFILLIILIILHGSFDDFFKVDSTTVLLVIILILLPFFHLIKKIKYGDFEAEITQKDVSEIEEKIKNIPQKEDKKIKTELANHLEELVESDPSLALAKVRIELERKIKILADVYLKNKLKFNSLKNSVHELAKKEIIDKNLELLLCDIINVANRSIHGEDISKRNAIKLINIAEKIIQELDYVIIDNIFKNETKEIIDQKKVDNYMNGLYILKTIVPLVKDPEMKTYKLNQAELDAFLEGYDEYAETIISLEKDK